MTTSHNVRPLNFPVCTKLTSYLPPLLDSFKHFFPPLYGRFVCVHKGIDNSEIRHAVARVQLFKLWREGKFWRMYGTEYRHAYLHPFSALGQQFYTSNANWDLVSTYLHGIELKFDHEWSWPTESLTSA